MANKQLKEQLEVEQRLREEFAAKIHALTESLITQNESIAKLVATNESIINENRELRSRIATLEQNEKPGHAYGEPPSYAAITRTILQVVNDADKAKEKSCRAVIERLPEQATDSETEESDKQTLEKVARASEKEYQIISEKCHRSGPKREGRNRILKVQFQSQKERDIFLRSFRSSVKKCPNVNQKITARRDMTDTELKLLYDLRRQCFELNAKSGLFKYIVQDLEIKELQNPKEFKVKNQS
ncbi:hypothetical protein Ddc_20135 [Ditylenchus destructor]|nr:hypothetical protein Ddc_20135 [Ditylenchus destructor]